MTYFGGTSGGRGIVKSRLASLSKHFDSLLFNGRQSKNSDELAEHTYRVCIIEHICTSLFRMYVKGFFTIMIG
jgi:hypothetical protein